MTATVYDGMTMHEAMNHLQWIEEEAGRIFTLLRGQKWLDSGELTTMYNHLHDLQYVVDTASNRAEHQRMYANLTTQERAELSLIQRNID